MTVAASEPLGIIGHDRYVIEQLAKKLYAEARKRGAHTNLRHTRRGYSFEVMTEVGSEPTGHVAKVTIELDRYEDPRSP